MHKHVHAIPNHPSLDYLIKAHQLSFVLHPRPAAVIAAAIVNFERHVADDAAAKGPYDVVRLQSAYVINVEQRAALQLAKCGSRSITPPSPPDILCCLAAPAVQDADNVQEHVLGSFTKALEAADQHSLQHIINLGVLALALTLYEFKHMLHMAEWQQCRKKDRDYPALHVCNVLTADYYSNFGATFSLP
jgi:hypothetical protein